MAQELKLALLGKQNLVIRHLLNRKRINFVINFRPPGLPASVSVPVSTVFWRGAEPFTPFSAPLRISTYTDIQCRWAVAHVSLDAKANKKLDWRPLGFTNHGGLWAHPLFNTEATHKTQILLLNKVWRRTQSLLSFPHQCNYSTKAALSCWRDELQWAVIPSDEPHEPRFWR